MVRRVVYFGVCVLAVCASAAVTHRVEEERTNEVDDSWWPNKQISVVQRMLNDCSSGDPFTVCLKAKAVTFLDRVLRKDTIQVLDGLSLVADEKTARGRSGRALTEEELVASLPRELGKKEETLDEMIVSKVTDFFSGRKLQIDMAEEGSDAAEPRRRNRNQYMMLAKLVAAGHLALALKGLALLAIKALFISKIAVVLAGLIAIKSLFSGGGHSSHKYEVITTDHHESGHDRVYAPEGYAQDLAYRGYPSKQQ